MRATLMYGAGDVRVEDVADSALKQPTDALVRFTASCICGSDLWPYGCMSPADGPARIGQGFLRFLEAVGPDLTNVKEGDLVVPRSPSPTAPVSSAGRDCTPRAPVRARS